MTFTLPTQTSLKLTEADVECLLNALLSQFPENLTEEENAYSDRLIKRLYRAQDRL